MKINADRLQSPASVTTTSLSDWDLNVEAEVIEAPCSTPLETRLREIGLVPGVHIRVIRKGSRMVIQVGEGRIAMRRADASTIRVQSIDSPSTVHSTAN